MAALSVNEIFYSIQGEGSYSGWPCVFIRLKGCHLRCHWCDTTYAFHEGQTMSVSEILASVRALSPSGFVEITGGEPLLQGDVYSLMDELGREGYSVMIETSGSISIAKVPTHVHIVMDLKAPASGEHEKNDWNNVAVLKRTDDIKIVIADDADFEWALSVLEQHPEHAGRFILQAAFGLYSPGTLARRILDSGQKIRLGIQLHKVAFDPSERGV